MFANSFAQNHCCTLKNCFQSFIARPAGKIYKSSVYTHKLITPCQCGRVEKKGLNGNSTGVFENFCENATVKLRPYNHVLKIYCQIRKQIMTNSSFTLRIVFLRALLNFCKAKSAGLHSVFLQQQSRIRFVIVCYFYSIGR